MGFGGGGSGSFVLPNHDHTNVLADGGELLEAISLIDGITLKAWLDAAILTAVPFTPKYELLDDHLAAGVESSYTFTPTVPLDIVDYSKFVVEISGDSSAAFDLRTVINGVGGTANNSIGGQFNAMLGLNFANAPYWTVASSALITAASKTFVVTLDIMLTDSGTQDIQGLSRATSTTGLSQWLGHLIFTAATTLTSIKVQTSTSTWKAGSRITIYGVRR